MLSLIATRRSLVPVFTVDWFREISAFYRNKHKEKDTPVFSCNAAEQFPGGWRKAFETGIWDEEGEYGDNFRAYFSLRKS